MKPKYYLEVDYGYSKSYEAFFVNKKDIYNFFNFVTESSSFYDWAVGFMVRARNGIMYTVTVVKNGVYVPYEGPIDFTNKK